MKTWKRPPISNKICLGFKQILKDKAKVLLALEHAEDKAAIKAALDYIESVTKFYWTRHPHKKPRK